VNPVTDFVRKLESLGIPESAKHPLRIARILINDLIRCDLLKQASAMAYVTLLSLVPSLVAIFCVLSLFSPLLGSGTSIIDQARGFILDHLAEGSGEQVINYLDHMLSGLSLSTMGWSSFASVLVTLIMLLRQIEEALNRIWLVRKGRHMLMRFVYFWTFLTLGAFVLAIAVGAASGFNLQALLSFGSQAHRPSPLVGEIAQVAGSFVFFFVLYKVVPNCTVAARAAAIGAGTSALLLNRAGRFYGMYVKNAHNYQTLYGALAQLPLFLTWLYICWVIILLGALVSWRLQEGFPREDEAAALSRPKGPLEQTRNLQIRALMPLICLAAIYQRFQEGTGRGLSGQDLAHTLKLPATWVNEALSSLEAMGYVIAAKTDDDVLGGPTLDDPYFPALPPQSLQLARVRSDLVRPVHTWLGQWHHELPLDLGWILDILASPHPGTFPEDATLAAALAASSAGKRARA